MLLGITIFVSLSHPKNAASPIVVTLSGMTISVNSTQYMKAHITSIYDTVVELLFTGMYEWQIRDKMWDITETAIAFTKHNQIIWTSGYSTAPDVRKRYCYAVANSMQWRFV